MQVAEARAHGAGPGPQLDHREAHEGPPVSTDSVSTGSVHTDSVNTDSVNTDSEAYLELLGMAEGRFGALSAELVARHVLAVTAGADWPVQRAAMEAAIRRWRFADRDGLSVASRPLGSAVLGAYRTRRKGSAARPYATHIEALDPPRASCDCPDYVRSSLGLCKHILVVLDSICAQPKRQARALGEQQEAAPNGAGRLRWDPVRPLTGAGDWLARVSFVDAVDGRARRSTALGNTRRWFARGNGSGAELRNAYGDDPARRLRVVCDLLRFVEAGKRKGNGCGSDPALEPLLRAEREALERVVDRRIPAAQLRRHLGTMKRKLYPYQIEGVQRFLEEGRLLLADDMGLGKTAQAIAACHVLHSAGKVRRGLVITPASLKSQWLREWTLFSPVPAELVEGNVDQRQEVYQRCRQGFVIANYEQVLRDLELMHRWRPDIVVLDEAQRIKNWATKTAAYVKKLGPAYRLVLTGTPMENRLEELASILEWVDPLALEPAWRLVPWHTRLSSGERGGARNLDTLRVRLRHRMVRRVRQEVLEQLPPRRDTRVPVELTETQQEAHDELNLPIARLVAMSKRRPLTQVQFLRLMSLLAQQRIICNGMALAGFPEVWPGLGSRTTPSDGLLQSLGSPKLAELRALIGTVAVQQGRKVVVFSQWRRMLQLAEWAVSDVLEAARLRGLFFTGKESQRLRTQNVIDFHDDPRAAVLFATDAGGVGLNLQRAATCCINVELPWNPAVLEQRIGRIYRLGQKHAIDVYNLVSEQGIESRILDLVGDKRALFSGLFDGSSDEVRFDRSSSFLERIEKIVEPVMVPDLPDLSLDVDEQETPLAELVAEHERATANIPETDEETHRETDEAADTVAASSGRGPAAPAPPALPAPAPPPAPAATSMPAVDALLRKVQIHTTPDGGISFTAPPEAASTLSALFQGMAQLLAGAATAAAAAEAQAAYAQPELPGVSPPSVRTAATHRS